jgi:hypothetical protein
MTHPRDHEEAEVVVDVDIRVGHREGVHIAVPPDLRNTENVSTYQMPVFIALTLSIG